MKTLLAMSNSTVWADKGTDCRKLMPDYLGRNAAFCALLRVARTIPFPNVGLPATFHASPLSQHESSTITALRRVHGILLARNSPRARVKHNRGTPAPAPPKSKGISMIPGNEALLSILRHVAGIQRLRHLPHHRCHAVP